MVKQYSYNSPNLVAPMMMWSNSNNNIELGRSPRPSVAFVLGGPGSGKGTNCERIVNEFDYVHLSTGDLLRTEKERNTQLGIEIESLINQGMLVPPEITVQVIKQEMKRRNASKYLVDGFPRNSESLQVWNHEMSQHYQIHFAIVLECSNQTMEERLILQRETNTRGDDSDVAIETRLKIYNEVSKHIVDELISVGVTVHHINAELDKESVYRDVRQLFKEIGDKSILDSEEHELNRSGSGGGGSSMEEGKASDEVVALIYEAPDGYRGTYDQVLAHEAKLEEIEQKKHGGVVSAMHN